MIPKKFLEFYHFGKVETLPLSSSRFCRKNPRLNVERNISISIPSKCMTHQSAIPKLEGGFFTMIT